MSEVQKKLETPAQEQPQEEPKKPSVDEVMAAIDLLLKAKQEERWVVSPELSQAITDLRKAVEDLKAAVKEFSGRPGFKPGLRPPLIEWDKAGVGPDVIALLEIQSGPDGKRTIHPKKYLAGEWEKINNYLRGLGFDWVSAGKKSHWREK